jgi:hypothetical protein
MSAEARRGFDFVATSFSGNEKSFTNDQVGAESFVSFERMILLQSIDTPHWSSSAVGATIHTDSMLSQS